MPTRSSTRVRQKFLTQQQAVLNELATCENPKAEYQNLLSSIPFAPAPALPNPTLAEPRAIVAPVQPASY